MGEPLITERTRDQGCEQALCEHQGLPRPIEPRFAPLNFAAAPDLGVRIGKLFTLDYVNTHRRGQRQRSSMGSSLWRYAADSEPATRRASAMIDA